MARDSRGRFTSGGGGGGSGSLGALFVQLLLDDSDYVAGMEGAKSDAKSFSASLKEVDLGVFADAFTKVGAGAAALGGALAALGAGAVSVSSEFEGFETRLATLIGGPDGLAKARERMAELAKQAAETPFELPQIVEAEINLRALGVEAERVMPMIQDFAGAMNVDLASAAVEVGRAMQFGAGAVETIAGRALRAQVELRTGQNALKMSTAEFRKELEVTLTDPNGIFAGGTAKLAKTFGGLISTLSDNWTMFLKRVGDAGIFASTKALVVEILEILNEQAETVGEIADLVGEDLVVSLALAVQGATALAQAFIVAEGVILALQRGILVLEKNFLQVLALPSKILGQENALTRAATAATQENARAIGELDAAFVDVQRRLDSAAAYGERLTNAVLEGARASNTFSKSMGSVATEAERAAKATEGMGEDIVFLQTLSDVFAENLAALSEEFDLLFAPVEDGLGPMRELEDAVNELAPPEALDRLDALTALLYRLQTEAAASEEAAAALADEIGRVQTAIEAEQTSGGLELGASAAGALGEAAAFAGGDLTSSIPQLIGAINPLAGAIAGLVLNMEQIVGDLMEQILELPTILANSPELLTGFVIDLMTKAFPALVDAIPEVVEAFITALLDPAFIVALMKLVVEGFLLTFGLDPRIYIAIAKGIVVGLQIAIPEIAKALGDAWSYFVSGEMRRDLITLLLVSWADFKEEVIATAREAAAAFFESLVEFLRAMGTQEGRREMARDAGGGARDITKEILTLGGAVTRYGDTPGVVEAGSGGLLAAFAPGDKVAAARTRDGLSGMVGGGSVSVVVVAEGRVLTAVQARAEELGTAVRTTRSRLRGATVGFDFGDFRRAGP